MSNKQDHGYITELKRYAKTDRETEFLDYILDGFSIENAGDMSGVSERTSHRMIKRLRDRAALQGYSPEHDMINTIPDTQYLKGRSALYKRSGENGEPVLEWVKSNAKVEDVQKVIQELTEAMIEDIPTYERINPTKVDRYEEDYLAVYPIGDPHLGLLSCMEEAGEDTTLESAATDLYSAMARLVQTLPHCANALIINTGDLFHMDDTTNQTKRSGHILDVSTNWPILLKVAIKTLRLCINEALKHHDHVTVMNVPGNHDDKSALILSATLEAAYENNERVHIVNEPKDYFSYRFGNNLIGAYHGHIIKKDKLPLVMANTWPKDWGDTEYRVWYTGHIHHDTVHEYDGCTVETVRTLANKDRYGMNHGYNSLRDMKAVLHHIDHGPIERHTVTIRMAREYAKEHGTPKVR